MPKSKEIKERGDPSRVKKQITELEKKIDQKLKHLQKIRKDCLCFPFLDVNITLSVVDDIFDELRTKYKECNGRLDVIVGSSGGDIDAAYNLSMLFRKYGDKELNFIVPRWAKSAATLLVCSGDKILMSPVAEFGPLDPQITQMNPLEGRLEQFSPLHIESTLEMIRREFEDGNEKLAEGLIERLQYPLTLGSFIKMHEIAEQYLVRLLETRMLSKGRKGAEAKEIARRLTKSYADHGFCINVDEAKNIGLKASELAGEELDVVWEIHKLNKEKKELQEKIRSEELIEMIKKLPPELLEKLSKPPRQESEAEQSKSEQEGNS